MRNNFKAQGSLEYLLLIGGAVLIAAIVVGLVANIGTQGGEAVKSRASDVICAAYNQNTCGITDPDRTGELLPLDCLWIPATNSCRSSTLANGLVFWTNFDTGPTSLSPIVGGVGDGTLNGNSAIVSDFKRKSKVLELDGINDYANFGDIGELEGLNEMSICAWVNLIDYPPPPPGSPTSFSSIAVKADNTNSYVWWLAFRNDNSLTMQIGNYGPFWQMITDPRDGKWHLVCGSWAGHEKPIKMYLDGIKKLEENSVLNIGAPAGMRDNGTFVSFGIHPTITADFEGKIDDVYFWDRALSDLEVKQLYEGTTK